MANQTVTTLAKDLAGTETERNLHTALSGESQAYLRYKWFEKKAKDDGAAVTDDCSAVELMGMSVKIVEGDERNIKVTTPMDLKIAEILLEEMQ